MLDTARITMYAEMRGSHYRTLHGVLRAVILVSATASMVTFLDAIFGNPSVGGLWPLVPNAIIGTAVIIDHLADFGTKIAVLNMAKRASQRLVDQDWRQLWDDIDSGAATVEEIRERSTALMHQLREATAAMDEHVKVNDKVNGISTLRAYQVMEAQYAAQ